MPVFLSSTQIAQRAGWDEDDDEIVEALDLTNSSGTFVLQELLCTKFERAVATDTFYIKDNIPRQRAGELKLFLSNMFVDTAQPITVRTALDRKDLPTGDVLDNSMITAVEEDGILVIDETYDSPVYNRLFSLTGHYLQVEYTYGFDVSNNVFQGIPDWLPEVANLVVKKLHISRDGCSDKECKQQCSQLENLYNMMLEPHIRRDWFAVKPTSIIG